MKYNIHENGWTAIINNYDIKTATNTDINLISRLIAHQTLIVIKNQKLTFKDELDFINKFPNAKPAFQKHESAFKRSAADLNLDPSGLICRVTGQKNSDGETGIAGHEDEMAWHNNSPYDSERNSIVYLYAVHGSKGSRTTFNNTTLAYRDLDNTMKEKIKNLKCLYFSGINLQTGKHTDAQENKEVVNDFTPPLVYTNIANKTGLYLSPYLLEKFTDLSVDDSKKIVDELFPFVIQEKYCYHHDWEDGDILLAEQWLGIHKRWKFKNIQTRLLHRAAMDFPEQDYTSIMNTYDSI